MTEKLSRDELIDLLCLADEALMKAIGCFPLDRTNEKEVFLNDACNAIRKQVTFEGPQRKFRAIAARKKWLAEYQRRLAAVKATCNFHEYCTLPYEVETKFCVHCGLEIRYEQ